MYKIEGLVDGQWREDHVISSGDPEEVNRYETMEEAQSVVDQLATIFDDADKLRVVPA